MDCSIYVAKGAFISYHGMCKFHVQNKSYGSYNFSTTTFVNCFVLCFLLVFVNLL